GPRFAALGLAPEPGVAAQLDDVLDRVVDRARHFAESVYPPHTLGATAEPGPFPVGVQTLALVDPSRTDVTGSGPRPVTIEVYYPSTPAAVAGVPHDVAEVLGIPVATTPAFRNVARAPPVGTFTDPRVRAIFPMAPAAVFADAFFASITVPTLIVGGTLDTTVPFAANQQRPFDALPAGALFDGLAELTDVGHFTFSDLCEVPRNLIAVIGG